MIIRKLLVNDGRAEREVLLIGTIVVGRDPSCQLTDLDPLLSRRHAEFVPSGKGVTVRDLKSRNGILVNGDKVPEHLLRPGDVVQLGHLHVRYVEELVVKSPEDHTRVSAITETGIEVPTLAPIARPVAPVPMGAAAAAPTSTDTAVTSIRDADLEITTTPMARSAPAASSSPAVAASAASAPAAYHDDDTTVVSAGRAAAPPAGPDDDTLRLPPLPSLEELQQAGADDLDPDATLAPIQRSTPAAPVPKRKDDDADATRVLWANATAVADDPEATVASKGVALDETRMPAGAKPGATAPIKTGASTEARIVANMSLIVTDASPNCQTVIGARPETIVGGGLGDLLARTVRFVATGDGPSALSVSVSRAAAGNTITVTFKTGQATGNHS